MNSPADRSKNRPIHARRGGIVSSEEILANIKASGVPDDDETTGTEGIRNSAWLKSQHDAGKRVGDL